jgi:hypothetical protein
MHETLGPCPLAAPWELGLSLTICQSVFNFLPAVRSTAQAQFLGLLLLNDSLLHAGGRWGSETTILAMYGPGMPIAASVSVSFVS